MKKCKCLVHFLVINAVMKKTALFEMGLLGNSLFYMKCTKFAHFWQTVHFFLSVDQELLLFRAFLRISAFLLIVHNQLPSSKLGLVQLQYMHFIWFSLSPFKKYSPRYRLSIAELNEIPETLSCSLNFKDLVIKHHEFTAYNIFST